MLVLKVQGAVANAAVKKLKNRDEWCSKYLPMPWKLRLKIREYTQIGAIDAYGDEHLRV